MGNGTNSMHTYLPWGSHLANQINISEYGHHMIILCSNNFYVVSADVANYCLNYYDCGIVRMCGPQIQQLKSLCLNYMQLYQSL